MICCLVSAACGSSGSAAGPDAFDPSTRNFPWQIGSEWTYRYTRPNSTVTGRKRTIAGMEDVGPPHTGTLALKVHVELYSGTKDIWEAYVGDLDVSYKTRFYDANGVLRYDRYEDPYRLKLDESPPHTVTGATWTETFSETDIVPGQQPSTRMPPITWKVVSDAEPITVVAGTFTALHVERIDMSMTPPEVVDYWYAKGVGRLKETGTGEIEELESYTLVP